MSETVTLNGESHVIPTRNETSWAVAVTDYLVDVCEVLNGGPQAVTVSGASTAIDFDLGRNVDITLGASTTLSFQHPRTGLPHVFWIVQGASWTITWPSSVKWPGGTPPDLSGGAGTYIVTLFYNATRAIYVGEYGSGSYY